MIDDARSDLREHPHLTLVPAVAMFIDGALDQPRRRLGPRQGVGPHRPHLFSPDTGPPGAPS